MVGGVVGVVALVDCPDPDWSKMGDCDCNKCNASIHVGASLSSVAPTAPNTVPIVPDMLTIVATKLSYSDLASGA